MVEENVVSEFRILGPPKFVIRNRGKVASGLPMIKRYYSHTHRGSSSAVTLCLSAFIRAIAARLRDLCEIALT